MSEDETTKVFDALKKKYPGLSDEDITDIMQTGAESGMIQPAARAAAVTTEPSEPEFEITKALKDGADLGEIMRFMIVDNWVKERFGKGKEIPPELRELLEKAKSGKGGGSDLDALLDRMMKYEMMESFMEGRKGRKQPQTDANVDVVKAIQDMGEKMTHALELHKAEDETKRAEERLNQAEKKAADAERKLRERDEAEAEEQWFQKRVKDKVDPLETKFNELLKIVQDRLKNVEPEKRKDLVLDLGQMITEELGDDIKNRVLEGVKAAFGEKEPPVITTDAAGKPTIDWYKLGERGLKTIEKFIERLPTQPPPRSQIKEMAKPLPKLPPSPEKPTELPPTPSTPPIAVPEKPKEPEKLPASVIPTALQFTAAVPEKPEEEPLETTPSVAQPTQPLTLPEASDHEAKPIILEKPTEEAKEPKAPEKPKNEPTVTEEHSQESRTTDQQQTAQPSS